MPLATAALWAVSGGIAVTSIELLMLLPLAGIAVLATALTWRRNSFTSTGESDLFWPG